jgi:NADH-quinone oxidoreductase subunit L
VFHLTTHAFFKALLFLGAGSVIIALHHEQDIWKMGNLRRRLPVTFWTFLVGTVALAGFWPLSGFFSKDSILAQAWKNNMGLFAIAAFVAMLTSFYMFRLVFVVFFNREKSEAAGHAHESPAVMVIPLRILAVLSVIAGIIGIEHFYARYFEGGGEPAPSLIEQLVLPFAHSPVAAILGLLAAAVGLGAAYALYARAERDPLPEKLGGLSRAMQNRFYFDELYQATVIRLHDALAAVADWIDRWLISGLAVRGTHGTTELVGRALRLLQTGNLQTYAFLFALGVAVVLWFMLK